MGPTMGVAVRWLRGDHRRQGGQLCQLATAEGIQEFADAAPVTLLLLDADGVIVRRSEGATRSLERLVAQHTEPVVDLLRAALRQVALECTTHWVTTRRTVQGPAGIVCIDIEVTKLRHGYAATYLDVTETARTVAKVERLAGELRADGTTLRDLGTMLAGGAAQISQQASVVADGSSELTSSIREIAARAEEAASGAHAVVDSTRQATDSIEHLRAASEQIGGIIRMISTIAGQTKLLALNATIEAARANEHGRGFGVVADEVKSLASRTAEATDAVTTMIDAVQRETENATNATQEIAHLIDAVAERQTEIASAVEQQTTTTAQMAEAIEAVARSVGDAASTASSVHAAAESVDGTARDLSDAVAR